MLQVQLMLAHQVETELRMICPDDEIDMHAPIRDLENDLVKPYHNTNWQMSLFLV